MKKKDAKWKKVRAPKYWRPAETGDSVEGKFAGFMQCTGQYGSYLAVALNGPEGLVYVTGVKALSLAQWARPAVEQTELKFVFTGYVDVGQEHEMRDYELFTR